MYRKEQDVVEISDDNVVEDLDDSECNDSAKSPYSSQMPLPESANATMIVQKDSSSSSDVDNLIGMFGQLSPKQINAIYLLSGNNFDRTLQCLLEGPSVNTIVAMMTNYFEANRTGAIKRFIFGQCLARHGWILQKLESRF